MENTVSYDTRLGFQIAVRSLEALNKIISARSEAHYTRNETLKPWVILGRFYFDKMGNVMKYVGKNIPAEIFPRIPAVLTEAELTEYVRNQGLNQEISFSASRENDIPNANQICPVCGQGWTIKNCHNTHLTHNYLEVDLTPYIGKTLRQIKDTWKKNPSATWFIQPDRMIRNERCLATAREGFITVSDNYIIQPGDETRVNVWTYRHPDCYHSYRAAKEQTYFANIFTEAGFQYPQFIPVENQYSPKNLDVPWFNVYADGLIFTVGSQHRVISICLLEPKNSPSFWDLFPKEETTKNVNNIDAWSRSKCIEYLRVIKNSVK